MRTIYLMITSICIAACGKSPGDAAPATQAPATAEVAPEGKPAGGGDPCTLVKDTAATFGQAVTARSVTYPNSPPTCEWKTAEGMLCGSVTVFGPGWFEGADVKTNFDAMVTSMGAFGEVKDVAGIGEAAKAVDGGILGAQIAFRTGNRAALVASGCRSGSVDQNAQADKLAREVSALL